jgi:hypothetical protein
MAQDARANSRAVDRTCACEYLCECWSISDGLVFQQAALTRLQSPDPRANGHTKLGQH